MLIELQASAGVDLEPLLTKEQAAEVLNVTTKLLDGWRWNGKGPEFVRIGRETRYTRAALQRYIDTQTRRPPVQAFLEDRHGLVQKSR